MTLPPVDHLNVRGLAGPAYKVDARCSNPNCGRFSDHAHHIFRRSALAGAYDWVQVGELIVANKTGVCAACHDDLTGRLGGHKAAIRLLDGTFVWCLLGSEGGEVTYLPAGALRPQPPTPESLARASGNPPEESESCPYCGQVKRRRPSQPPGGRRRKTWLVRVPADVEENGADVLDSLVDNLSPLIPNGDSSTNGRYYVLVPVLAYAMMESSRFAKTMKGIGG